MGDVGAGLGRGGGVPFEMDGDEVKADTHMAEIKEAVTVSHKKRDAARRSISHTGRAST